jgi:hypothetical protein
VDHVLLLSALTAVGARHPTTLVGVAPASNVSEQLSTNPTWSRVEVDAGAAAGAGPVLFPLYQPNFSLATMDAGAAAGTARFVRQKFALGDAFGSHA